MTTQPAPTPPGWYPDPGAVNTMRYWDGRSWTPQSAPMVAMTQPAAPGVNHLLHLILTLVSCGLWAPIWLLLAVMAHHARDATPWPRWVRVAVVALLVIVVAWVMIVRVANGQSAYG